MNKPAVMNNDAAIKTHAETHFESNHFVRDVVIGMADGLTVPFALAAGLSGAVGHSANSSFIIVTAGIAEIAAGSIAMGLGGYLAGRTEVDHYSAELTREYYEVEKFPEKEKQEVQEVLQGFGVSADTSVLISEEMSRDPDKWVNFMMRFELGLEKPDEKRATKSALNIGVAYIVGGLIPLCPYIFIHQAGHALLVSVAITLVALFGFGYFKSVATGQPALTGAFKTMIIGAVAAGAAFGLARLVSNFEHV